MPGGVPVEQTTPDEAAFQAWKKKQAQAGSSSPHAPVPDEDEFQAWKAKQATPVSSLGAPDRADTPAPPPRMSTFNKIATHVGNIGSGIPGVEAAGAYLGSKVAGVPYQEALRRIREQQDQAIGPKAKIVERMVGAAPLAAVLPGSPAVGGALLGGADQALSADPMSLTQRGVRTGLGAGAGAVTGKLLDMGTTAVKSFFTKDPATNIIARQADRAQSAKTLYDAARREGQQNEATSTIRAFLAEPEIASRVEALQGLDQFKNTPADSPEMLDALYKSLSDEAKAIDKGLAAQDPTKPNTGRYRQQAIGTLKQRLLNAMGAPGTKPPLKLEVAPETYSVEPQVVNPGREPQTGHMMDGTAGRARGDQAQVSVGPNGQATAVSPRDVQGPAGPAFMLRGQPRKVIPGVDIQTPGMTIETAPAEAQPPMMPSYRAAVEDFAKRTRDIKAVGTGMTASQAASSPSRPTFEQITSNNPQTPQTFAEWAKTATPDEIAAARQGILGDIKNSLSQPGKTFAPFRRASAKGAELLRSAPTEGQSITDLLQRLGLTSLNSPFANP